MLHGCSEWEREVQNHDFWMWHVQMRSALYLELLEKETLRSMAPMRGVPGKAGNLSAIHAELRSAIELTRFFMTCEQMKRKSRWL